MKHRSHLIVAALLISGCLASQPARAESGKIVQFTLAGPISETPRDPLMFSFTPDNSISLKELLERIKKASEDSEVKAAVFVVGQPDFGWAQLQELRKAIDVLKAHKDVFFYAEDLWSATYALACSGSHVCMPPTSDLWLIGMYGESPYLRSMLDWIGVYPDFLHIGDYKSAAETLTRTGPSDEAQKMMDWLFDSIYDNLVKMIASSRKLDPAAVRSLIDQGPYSAEKAKAAGLIDEVEYRAIFMKKLKERFGEDVKIVKNYGEDKGPDLDLSSPFAVFGLLNKLMNPEKEGAKSSVAIVYVDGAISLGKAEPDPFGGSSGAKSTTISQALEKAADDDSVKAVVLRVDSPGGSALASEIIWKSTQNVIKSGKPMVVSMGNVAGSGGYYVSCGADRIFAEDTTITASIGVVGGKLVTKDMWDHLKINWHPHQRGAQAAILSTSHPFSETEKAKIEAWMNDIYEVFKSRVSATRKSKLSKPLEDMAGGRVFTGEQALKLGLVDEIGGLTEAIKYAASQAKLGEYDIRVLPKPKNFFDLIREAMGLEEDEEQASVSLAKTPSLLAPSSPLMQAVLPLLQQLDSKKAKALQNSLITLDMIQREGVITMMPCELTAP